LTKGRELIFPVSPLYKGGLRGVNSGFLKREFFEQMLNGIMEKWQE
jgi:hypothetical protein